MDDFADSKDADIIVKNNKHFVSGRSQIFKIKNAYHNVYVGNPEALMYYMNGFFDGSLRGYFDLSYTYSKVNEENKRRAKL